MRAKHKLIRARERFVNIKDSSKSENPTRKNKFSVRGTISLQQKKINASQGLV